MPRADAPRSSLPPHWGNVIDQVDETVTQMLAAVRLREQALQDETRKRDLDPPLTAKLGPTLEAMRQMLLGLKELADRAGAVVRETDAGLGDREETMRQWIERSRRLNRTLAELADKG